MGWLFPLGGFVAFLIPVFYPPKEEEFEEEVLNIFKEDWVPDRILSKGEEDEAKEKEEAAKKAAQTKGEDAKVVDGVEMPNLDGKTEGAQ